MKIKKVISILKDRGYDFNIVYIPFAYKKPTKDGKPKHSAIAIEFKNEKVLIAQYPKYANAAKVLYPSDWHINSFPKGSVPYETEDELINGINKCLLYRINIGKQSNSKRDIPYEWLTTKAKENRDNPTLYEKLFRELLIDYDIPFKEQIPMCGKYIADFLIYDRIIVEVDGEYHSKKEQMVKDKNRTKQIEKKGYLVVRCTNDEVLLKKFKDPLLNRILN